MYDQLKLNLSYDGFKAIIEEDIRAKLKMKDKAEQPYEYAMFYHQAVAILYMWEKIAYQSVGNKYYDQIQQDLLYFKEIIEPPRW